MESLKSTRASAFLAVGLVALFTASCATKKYVQTKVLQPLEAKISGVDKKTEENSTQITEVDRKAEAGISDVNSKAENAAQSAAKAGKDSVVIISADATATHQSVITVMEAARRVGLSQITFATQTSAQAGGVPGSGGGDCGGPGGGLSGSSAGFPGIGGTSSRLGGGFG